MTNPTDRKVGFVEDQRRTFDIVDGVGHISKSLARKDALLAEAAEVLRDIPVYAIDHASPSLIVWYQDRAKPLLDALEGGN